MLEKTSRKERLLAGAAGTTLVLGLAVSFGALPGAGAEEPDSVLVASRVEQVTAAPVLLVEPPPAAVPPPVVEAAAPPPVVSAPKAAAPKAPPSPASARTAAAAKPPARAVAAPPPPVAGSVVVPAPPVAPVLAAVPRRTPSPAEVKQAIDELRSRVGGLLRFVSPTATQLHQGGDQVCTGFDNGLTFEQVRSAGLSSMPSSVKVSPENADWAVRKLVTLYCPGHAGKLT